jgi:predicted RNA binding protein YcfA (HicA-like mRNA interferase family)
VKPISAKDFARLLRQHGWEQARVKGSHHVYTKRGNPARISLPIHANQSVKTGLLKHLMALADIDETEL